MKPVTYYLLSCVFLSSLHCVAMDIAEIVSAYESDDEVSQTSKAKKTVNKMDIGFITHPQHIRTFKKRAYRTFRQRKNTVVAPTNKQSVTIAEVELMIDALSGVAQEPIQKAPIVPQAKPVIKLSKESLVQDVLIPIRVDDVTNTLAIFKSESGSRYYILCRRCSTTKQRFLEGKTFGIVYNNFRTHLKKKHKLSPEEVLAEAPPRQ